MAIWTVSISQHEKFADPNDGCQRKWALDAYGSGEEYVQRLGAYRGEATHSMIRAWGQHGLPPERALPGVIAHLEQDHAEELAEKQISAEDYARRIVEVVNKMTPSLPAPKWDSTIVCERKAKIEIDGVPWSTKPDFESLTHLRDYKIVWSRQDVKTEVDLVLDGQANLYAYARLMRDPSESSVNCEWHYGVPGKSPYATTRKFTLPRAHVFEQVARLNEAGKKIYHLALAKPDPLTLQPNWNACGSYGGCKYLGKCKPSAADLVNIDDDDRNTTEKKTMGLLDDLAKKNTKPADAKPATAPATAKAAPEGAPSNDKAEALGKAKRMIALGIPVQEVINGLQPMYPKLTTADITEIVEVAGMTSTPAPTQTVATEVPKGNNPAKVEEKTDAPAEAPKRGPGRPAKPPADVDAAKVSAFAMYQLINQLAEEIGSAKDLDLKTRVALAAMLIPGK